MLALDAAKVAVDDADALGSGADDRGGLDAAVAADAANCRCATPASARAAPAPAPAIEPAPTQKPTPPSRPATMASWLPRSLLRIFVGVGGGGGERRGGGGGRERFAMRAPTGCRGASSSCCC